MREKKGTRNSKNMAEEESGLRGLEGSRTMVNLAISSHTLEVKVEIIPKK